MGLISRVSSRTYRNYSIMSTRAVRESATKQNELHRRILTRILNEEGNKTCADCTERMPRWASWSLGIFICLKCSGCHRSLGVHISKVKSINLDTWTRDQVNHIAVRGNKWANEYYLDRHAKGITYKIQEGDPNLSQFIKNKYNYKKFMKQGKMPNLNDKSELIEMCEIEVYGYSSSGKHSKTTKTKQKSFNISGPVDKKMNSSNSSKISNVSVNSTTKTERLKSAASGEAPNLLVDFGDFGQFNETKKETATDNKEVDLFSGFDLNPVPKTQNKPVEQDPKPDLFTADFSSFPTTESKTTNPFEDLNSKPQIKSEPPKNSKQDKIADIMAIFKNNPGTSMVQNNINNSNSLDFGSLNLNSGNSLTNNMAQSNSMDQGQLFNTSSQPK